MPIYEYLCASCGKVTEALQRFSDPPLTVCPHCQGALRKRISAPAFHFKGSGWYATDYAKKSGSGGGSSGESEKGGSGSDSVESSGSSSPKAEGSPGGSEPAGKPSGDSGSKE
jgi:putative FmdB family regulatory protein